MIVAKAIGGRDVANVAEIYPTTTLFARLDLVLIDHHMAVGNWAPSVEAAIHVSQLRLRLDARHYDLFFCVPPELRLGCSLLRAEPKKSGLNAVCRHDNLVADSAARCRLGDPLFRGRFRWYRRTDARLYLADTRKPSGNWHVAAASPPLHVRTLVTSQG